jgi:hypothetical protein
MQGCRGEPGQGSHQALGKGPSTACVLFRWQNFTPGIMRKELKAAQVHYPVKRVLAGCIVAKKPRAHNREERRFVAELVSELCGLAPYEKKAAALIERKEMDEATAFLKQRLGSMKRAGKKAAKLRETLVE